MICFLLITNQETKINPMEMYKALAQHDDDHLCDVDPLGDDFGSCCGLRVERKASDDCRYHSVRYGIELKRMINIS